MALSELIQRLEIKVPLIVAPMAGGPSSPELVAAASNAGALGSIGGAYINGAALSEFVDKVRTLTPRPFLINLFVPADEPKLSGAQVARAIAATAKYREELSLTAPTLIPPFQEDFDAQFEAVLKAKPKAFSFVFGLLDRPYILEAQRQNIYVIGTATTLEEALALQDAQVDAITLQGVEGGGHRGIFDREAEDSEVPLLKLLEDCRPRIFLPLIAAGGIMNSANIQSVLSGGADAVQMGTAFLACREAGTSRPYRERLLASADRSTKTTRVFSGRLARGMVNRFVTEMEERDPGSILPFPAQNKFTRDLRNASAKAGSADFLSLWAGTGSGLLWTGGAAEFVRELFRDGE
jgi:nitronate monooxygenase